MLTSYRELGKTRANPYARKDNNFKLEDCDPADTCMDTLESATIAGTEVIASVVFNGQTFLPSEDVETPDGEVIMKAPGTITAADTADLKAWLEAIAKTAEFDVYVTVEHDTTTLTVIHVGQKTLTSISTDAPETIDGSRCCLLYDVFTNEISVPAGAATTLTVDGVDAALDTGTYADGTATTNLVDDIKSELTALGVPFSSVTATFDSGVSEHDVVIVSTGRFIKIDSLTATNMASSEAFICS